MLEFLLVFTMLVVPSGKAAVLQPRVASSYNVSSVGLCTVSLPSNGQCQQTRATDLQQNQNTYKLVTTQLGFYKALDMSATMLAGIYQSDPLNAHLMGLYTGMIVKNLKRAQAFLVGSYGQEFKQIDKYQELFEFFVDSQKVGVALDDQKYFKFPSKDPLTPFKKTINMCKWREDQYFTEQRLAGPNPMSIQRLSYHTGDPGMAWSTLMRTKLNNTFPWSTIITGAIGKYMTFSNALYNRYVYVLHYPEYDGLTARPEASIIPGRKIKKVVSPIAIFVSKASSSRPNRLIPVAIQMGHTKDSPVYTPDNPDEWLLAKQTVQVADYAYGQSVEHLLKTHILMEPICAVLHRSLHYLHPLNQILKYHCKGIFGANKFGSPYLLHPYNGTIEKLFAVGFNGAKNMIAKAFSQMHWDMTNPNKNIKDRGMDDVNKVPYYPYRDDGKVIYDVISNLVKEYVALYYKADFDVQNDYELQSFIFEIHDVLKLPGFPAILLTRNALEDVLARLIWTTSAQHSAVNYPGSYYTAYTPNMPSKLYDDPRVTPGNFDVLNLPGLYYATIQATITMTLTALHYDTLFDYGKHLDDANAQALYAKYALQLDGTIKNQLEKRNKERYNAGHLTYPYLVPGWIANSIHT